MPSTGVTQWYYYVALSVLTAIVLICICLLIWCKCHRKSQAPVARSDYNATESTVVIVPPREPACIELSQQETGPNISEESDIYTHTPVEETTPMMTTEKQDSTDKEVCGVSVWNTSGI